MAAAVAGFCASALTLSTCERPSVDTSTRESRMSIIRSARPSAALPVSGASCVLAGVRRSSQASSAAGMYWRGFRRDQSDGLCSSGLKAGSSRSFSSSITCLAMLRDCRMNPSFWTRSASGLTSAMIASTFSTRGAWTPTSTRASET